MVVHATPKTHPGGVQGAWFKSKYQEVVGPLSISQEPTAKAPKFIVRNKRISFVLIMVQRYSNITLFNKFNKVLNKNIYFFDFVQISLTKLKQKNYEN